MCKSKEKNVLRRFMGMLMLFMVSVPSIQASTTPVSAALSALKSIDYRYFVAGGTCAAISHGITTPIDVVKTRIQANPKVYDKGMAHATVSIIKTEGPATLLSGLGPTVVGYGVEGAMKFGVYEVCKPIFKSLLSTAEKDNTAIAYILASVMAGAIAALLLCPMESLRIRQVTDPSYAHDSLITGLPKLIRQDGLFALFNGVWAMLAKQVPYTFGKQVSFDVIAGVIYSLASKLEDTKFVIQAWMVSVVSAFLASIVACLFSQPGDMILTETYKTTTPEPFGKVLRNIYERGGVGEFFVGTSARIVHVGLIITSQLVIYDVVKQALGLPATGSH